MAFQFMHIENFSRKGKDGRTVDFVLGEASRRPDCIPHVQKPIPPTVIFGASLNELRHLHDSLCETVQVELKSGKKRSVASNQHTLHTVVCSHPLTIAECRQSREARDEVRKWERLTIDWLKRQYGEDLKTVIRHTDEDHAHLHAYVIPQDLKVRLLHPGEKAKSDAIAAGATNKDGDRAYRKAMRAFQDSYSREVGQPAGLTRLGPARRRLTRQEWQAEQVQARALKEAIEKSEKVDLEIQSKFKELDSVKKEISNISGFAQKFRGLIDGFMQSSIAEKVSEKFRHEMQVLRNTMQSMILTEREKRRKVENDLKAIKYSVRSLISQRNEAFKEVQDLRKKYEPENLEYKRGYNIT